MALLVNMKNRSALFPCGFSRNFSAKIQIAGAEYALVYVIVKSSFTHRHACRKGIICNRKRYSVLNKRNNSFLNMFYLTFSKRNA